MAKKQIARWTAEETLRFLEIFRGYEALWDASHETYLKKNAREEAVRKLMEELIAANFDIPDEECLKKRIKNIKDSYRSLRVTTVEAINPSDFEVAIIAAIKSLRVTTALQTILFRAYDNGRQHLPKTDKF